MRKRSMNLDLCFYSFRFVFYWNESARVSCLIIIETEGFTKAQANVAQRRKRNEIHLEKSRNLRAAVEATVRQVKHTFPAGKLPVRGQFRVACMMIGSAAMSNIRRIQSYSAMKAAQNNKKRTEMERKGTHVDPFLSFLMDVLWRFLATFAFDNCVFGF